MQFQIFPSQILIISYIEYGIIKQGKRDLEGWAYSRYPRVTKFRKIEQHFWLTEDWLDFQDTKEKIEQQLINTRRIWRSLRYWLLNRQTSLTVPQNKVEPDSKAIQQPVTCIFYFCFIFYFIGRSGSRLHRMSLRKEIKKGEI